MTEMDGNARHILAFIGDAPVGTGRWRLEEGNNVAVIELLGVVEDKRRLGYGTKMLEQIVQDILKYKASSGSITEIVSMLIPSTKDTEPMIAMSLFQRCGFCLADQNKGIMKRLI